MTEAVKSDPLVAHAADIVVAYVSRNAVSTADLPALIRNVHSALSTIVTPQIQKEPAPELVPAVPVRRSITPEQIICLEDGKAFKSLKRHLRTSYNLTPEQYRAKWGLPVDYPMVAPNYSSTRSRLAKENGLGRAN